MDHGIDYEDMYASPSPSRSPPRRKISKLNTGQRNQITATTRNSGQKRAQTLQQAGPSRLNSHTLTANDMVGALPPYNDNSSWVDDPINHKVYMIGGIRPLDDTYEPTSDFFCYDTTTMKWEDLTDSLAFRVPADRYNDIEVERLKQPIPRLTQPGCTLWRRGNASFIFMFGGYNSSEERPSSQVIIINLNAREWWYEESLIAGEERPGPRISPSLVAVDNRIFIFGGYRSYEADPQACFSYSIAEWKPPSVNSSSQWHWEHFDVAYELPMPPNAVVGQAVSVYNGKLIALAPGRTNNKDRANKLLQFTDQNLFYFRPIDQKFQPIPMVGEGPKNVGWYRIYDLQSTMTPISLTNSSAGSSLPISATISRKRGRPHKDARLVPKPTSPTSSQLVQQPPLFPAIPSIIICAWIAQPLTPGGRLDLDQKDPEDLPYTPDMWRFIFTPVDQCEKLNFMERIAQLGQDFQGFTVHDGRMHLIGCDHRRLSERSQGDSWNIYLDIPHLNAAFL